VGKPLLLESIFPLSAGVTATVTGTYAIEVKQRKTRILTDNKKEKKKKRKKREQERKGGPLQGGGGGGEKEREGGGDVVRWVRTWDNGWDGLIFIFTFFSRCGGPFFAF
jgi:hypothetical protein